MDSNLANIALIEEMYAKFQDNPASVDSSWRDFFENLDEQVPSRPHVSSKVEDDARICDLVNAYRKYGHLLAKINPISTSELKEPYELSLKSSGFKQEELAQSFPTCGLLPQKTATLQEIVDVLKAIYSDKIGVEYMGWLRPDLELWLQAQIEPNRFKIKLSIDQKKMILKSLNKSELLESFLHTKYVGQKRFSIEGCESFVPVIECIISTGVDLGAEEFFIGMAHRGRLNILSNVLDKSYADIFSEFEEGYIPESFEGSGDVKYHKGFTSDVKTVKGHKVRVNLTPNPSHLESVAPVVEGQTKSKQVLAKDEKGERIIPILVHGDAAISGQGVVYETMQFGNLEGFGTGGTIHVVINNQIGFTTLPSDARSTRYCTDIARAFGAPIFHVNAEDPESCFYATLLAVEIRQKFHCDVFIDIVCYRKYGHNESDEPAFTQPLEYQLIRKKKSIREIYRDDLISQGVLEREMAEALELEFKKNLQDALTGIKIPKKDHKTKENGISKQHYSFAPIPTGVSKDLLQQFAEKLSVVPPGFKLHPKLENLIKERLAMTKEGADSRPMDWGMGETLAYASLLWNGTNIRISGQDVGRGTFSHRHGLWMDQVKEEGYYPLKHLKPNQGRFDLYNSPLSEFAVLGFEFGYSVVQLNALVVWEAQFGDFANGAQIITDEYITTSEQKWNQLSSLVMYLPHGYEGQGPDHSSGRIERFLSLAGNDNIQVVNPTTPAQLFHLLRRQVLNPIKKPLVVFTPKGLLRHPECVSQLVDFTRGSFQYVLDDPNPPKKARKLVFCSGRIYYDLASARGKFNVDDMAIVRIEQLYPLDIEQVKEILKNYTGFSECYWVQEEPVNMGAWFFIEPILSGLLPEGQILRYIGRERSASPAVGSHAVHKKEHEVIINGLFGKGKPSIFEIAGQTKGK
jgi:2-oxoglutarate dehydrogenase E1 component